MGIFDIIKQQSGAANPQQTNQAFQNVMGGGAQALSPLMGMTNRPISMGQVLAAAGSGLSGGMQQARQQNMQEQMQEQQRQLIQQKMLDAQAQKQSAAATSQALNQYAQKYGLPENMPASFYAEYQKSQNKGPLSGAGKLQADLASGRITQEQYDAEMAIRSKQGTVTNIPAGYTPMPDGSLKPIPGGPADPSAKGLTEGQAKSTLYYGQMTSAEDTYLKALERSGIDLSQKGDQLDVALASGIGNVMASPIGQQLKQAQSQWAEGFLRAKTGAAATESEVDLNVKTFFPQVGDSKEVIQQKREMRELANKQIRILAGAGADKIDESMSPKDKGGIDKKDPLGLR